MGIPFNKPYVAGKELWYIAQAHARGQMAGDGAFTKQCSAWLEQRTGCHKAQGMDLSADPIALLRLYTAAEQAKIELSTVMSTTVNLPYIASTPTGPAHLNLEFTLSPGQAVTQILNAYTAVYALALIALAVPALLVLSVRQELLLAPALLPLTVLGVLASVLIAIGEIQSRYVFAAWLILPVYVGAVLARPWDRAGLGGIIRSRFFDIVTASALPVALVLVAVAWLWTFDTSDGRFIGSERLVSSTSIQGTWAMGRGCGVEQFQ